MLSHESTINGLGLPVEVVAGYDVGAGCECRWRWPNSSYTAKAMGMSVKWRDGERQKRDEESARWILTETARSVEAARESSAGRDTGPLHMTIMTRT